MRFLRTIANPSIGTPYARALSNLLMDRIESFYAGPTGSPQDGGFGHAFVFSPLLGSSRSGEIFSSFQVCQPDTQLTPTGHGHGLHQQNLGCGARLAFVREGIGKGSVGFRGLNVFIGSHGNSSWRRLTPMNANRTKVLWEVAEGKALLATARRGLYAGLLLQSVFFCA